MTGKATRDRHAPAGWFPDPADSTRMRWWDGTRWTEHVHPVAETAPVPTAPGASPVPGPPAPGRGSRRAPLLVSLVAAGVVVLLAVISVVVWGVIAATAPKYALADSAFYQRAEGLLRETVQTGEREPLDFPGSWNVRLSPGYTAATRQYVEDFLADYDADGRLFDSENAAEEYAYDVATRELDELARQIESGGAGLAFAEESFPLPDDVVALEQEIAAYPIAPGADGTYWDSARAIAAIVDTELETDESLNDCLGFAKRPMSGFFCASEANWGRVFLTPLGTARADHPAFVDVVKHELSHKLILIQCQGSYATMSPYATWSDDIGEGVTNAYAVMFLGANPDLLFAAEDYAITDETYARAQAIHDGDLGCFDDFQPPPAE